MGNERPRKVVRRTAKKVEATSPGDVIECSVTAETTNKQGAKFWAKAGLSSTHREGETTEQAWTRVEDFTIQRTDELIKEWRK
jgi:hypothetical protein